MKLCIRWTSHLMKSRFDEKALRWKGTPPFTDVYLSHLLVVKVIFNSFSNRRTGFWTLWQVFHSLVLLASCWCASQGINFKCRCHIDSWSSLQTQTQIHKLQNFFLQIFLHFIFSPFQPQLTMPYLLVLWVLGLSLRWTLRLCGKNWLHSLSLILYLCL